MGATPRSAENAGASARGASTLASAAALAQRNARMFRPHTLIWSKTYASRRFGSITKPPRKADFERVWRMRHRYLEFSAFSATFPSTYRLVFVRFRRHEQARSYTCR